MPLNIYLSALPEVVPHLVVVVVQDLGHLRDAEGGLCEGSADGSRT